jgi:hypothetical protein
MPQKNILKLYQYTISIYNIAFVNSERWLAKSRVDITQCQHGKFPPLVNTEIFLILRAIDIAIL